ncbi:MAG: heparinase II/III family protein [Coriobacteriia bacterium]|nr:heparinase II/III family protein [Coriobacteriia bacterium]
MTLGRHIRRALTLPPRVVAKKAAARAAGAVRMHVARARDLRRPTYAEETARLADPVLAVSPANQIEEVDVRAAERYIAHEFSLLGSGAVRVAHGVGCQGVEGHRYPPGEPVVPDSEGLWLVPRTGRLNAPYAQAAWRSVSPGYPPIDWQLDFKSGYRWSERTWYRDIRYGHLPGVDVKVPWELARCQHLPELARVAVLTEDPALAERCAREVVDQVCDFIAQNPPRFGVNWACPMDVGIRAANWTIAVDFLRSAGVTLDREFERLLAGSLLAHGRHIIDNLEWTPELRSNHYLADVAGLLFIAAHLMPDPETDAWLAFAIQELQKATQEQFYPDGGNFEGSTSYHLLSLDMVSWAHALIVRLPPKRLERLTAYDPSLVQAGPGLSPPPADVAGATRALAQCFAIGARFAAALKRPDGLIPQFGDNDSGRFARVSLDVLDGGLVGFGDAVLPAVVPCVGEASAVAELRQRIQSGEVHAREYVFAGSSLTDGLEVACFPHSGVYVYRSERLYLAVRCGQIGQNGAGGHDHCDQLGIELWLDGRPVVRDPGTYLYTPLPERRNEYRSAKAHFVPRVPGREPARLDLGLFVLPGARPGVCEYAGPDAFVGWHDGYGEAVWRLIEGRDDAVVVTDASTLDLEDLRDHRPPPYSPGYGLLDRGD